MVSLPALRLSALLVPLLLATATAAAAQAAPEAPRPTQVKGLRTPKVALYSCADSSKKEKEVSKAEFSGPWPVDPDEKVAAGLLPVKVNGTVYCVRLYAVETDNPVKATSECGALVAANQPGMGATRGVGNECKNKK